MNVIGKNGKNIIVELNENDLENYTIETDYFKKVIGCNLKAGLLQQASKELRAAKKDLENFVIYHSKAFERVVKAGTLIGLLFENKTDEMYEQPADKIKP